MIKLIEEKEHIQERFNAVEIAVEISKYFIRDLRNNHSRAKEVLDSKVKQFQCSITKKKEIAKEEIELLKQKSKMVKKILEEKNKESQEKNALNLILRSKEEYDQLEEE